MKNLLLKSSLIVPALGLFVLGGVVTSTAFADTSANDTTRSDHPPAFQHQDLTDVQKAALEQARALHQAGDEDGAKAVLEAAGVPFPPHGGDRADRPELTDAQKAVLDQAKALRDAGDQEGAKALLDEAGIKPPMMHGHHGERFENLSDEQKAALEQAHALHQAGDEDGAKAVLEAAGVPFPPHGERPAN